MGEEESIGLDSPKVRAFRGRCLPASSRLKLTDVIAPAAPHLTVLTILILLLLYGYEIFNFSLSIDEEVYSHDLAVWEWISQGRWASGVLDRLLPPIGDIPMLSTVLFCAGIGVSSCLLEGCCSAVLRLSAPSLPCSSHFRYGPTWLSLI